MLADLLFAGLFLTVGEILRVFKFFAIPWFGLNI